MSLVWFITGTSNGIGRDLSLKALAAGHKVIAAMRNPERSAAAAKMIKDAGGEIFQLDSDESQASIKSKIRAAEKIYGKIDVLVNNAGRSVLGPFENFSEKEIVAQFRTNVFGPVFITQAALPGMRSRRSGTIINITSVAGQDAIPTCSLYAGSKFGLEGFTEGLSKEVAEFGINVLLVEPGAFRTNFLGAMEEGEKSIDEVYKGTIVDQFMQKFHAADGKQPGDPEKAARYIVEIASGEGQAGPLKGKLLRLVLGKDAYTRTTTKIDRLRKDMEASQDITFSTDF